MLTLHVLLVLLTSNGNNNNNNNNSNKKSSQKQVWQKWKFFLIWFLAISSFNSRSLSFQLHKIKCSVQLHFIYFNCLLLFFFYNNNNSNYLKIVARKIIQIKIILKLICCKTFRFEYLNVSFSVYKKFLLICKSTLKEILFRKKFFFN